MQTYRNIALILMGLLGGWAVQAIAADSTYQPIRPPFPSVAGTTAAVTTTPIKIASIQESSSSSLAGVSDTAIPVLSSPSTLASSAEEIGVPPTVSATPKAVPLPVSNKSNSTHSKRTASKNQNVASTAVSLPAKQAVQKSLAWANNSHAMPSLTENGRITFMYGDSAPTITCAPLRVCDIELEPGENVQGAPHVGDTVRWKISPAISKENNQTITHLIIKATESNLDTNLIVPTDRRTYHLRLVSTPKKYASRVSFEYPESNALAWQKISQSATEGKISSNVSSNNDFPPISVDNIHFNYTVKKVKGHPKFKPVRVMDDGARTFITMNDTMPVEEAPVVIMIGEDKQEQIVNYRLKGNMFIIDRILDKVALISGVGRSQQRIEITRKTCVKSLFNRCTSPTE